MPTLNKNEFYCVKCRNKCKANSVSNVTLKNGRHALKGKCEKCNTVVYKFV